jgi:hypothetical protein
MYLDVRFGFVPNSLAARTKPHLLAETHQDEKLPVVPASTDRALLRPNTRFTEPASRPLPLTIPQRKLSVPLINTHPTRTQRAHFS